MVFFRRIKCHFCGARSAHAKGSGIPDFQCASCEAFNYLDPQGNIIDTPWAAAAPPSANSLDRPQKLFESFTRDAADDPARGHQTQQIFCNTCLQNQQIYNEALANYLPDEDHPQYAEYERALPKWKQDLEKRYPQICTACAPRAQLKINRADYYGVMNNLNRAQMKGNNRRRGASPGPVSESRDDWHKRGMRVLLGLFGLAMWASMVAQVLWHVYGIWNTLFGKTVGITEEDDMALDMDLESCLAGAYRLQTEEYCHQLFGGFMPKILLASLCLIWYNHGLRAFYNPKIRYDHISGQKQHFWIQFVVLVVRTGSFLGLSDESRLQQMKWSHIVAVHGATIAFMLGGRWLARGAIQIHKWRLNKKIMPKPEDQDVLGQYAGPAVEKHTPKAASKLPFDIFAKKHKEPIQIQNLAPRRSPYGTQIWNRHPGGAPPSPNGSDSTIEDAMDLDSAPPAQSRMPGAPDTRRFNPNASRATGQQTRQLNVTQRFGAPANKGWEDVRSNLFSIEDEMRAQIERQKFQAAQNAHKLGYNPPAEQSPFRGRLPQAPMSMERRLRNPISQVPQFKEPPVTQQKNFLDQMREGIDKGKTIGRRSNANTNTNQRRPHTADETDDDASDIMSTTEFSPAAARTRGDLDLRPSSWQLPNDPAMQATGLEDLFGGHSFRISESPELPPDARRAARSVPAGTIWTLVATVVVVALAMGVYNVPRARRWVFLSLYDFVVRLGL
ncbi:hypothetical protein Q7P37_008841 [Cladosporium fusiforme]